MKCYVKRKHTTYNDQVIKGLARQHDNNKDESLIEDGNSL